MKVRQSLRRLTGRLQQNAEARPDFRLILGTVTDTSQAATSLPGRAGNPVAGISVLVNGSTIVAPYLASYTPVINDLVWVVLIDKSPAVLGKPTGFPTF